jgi:hypothetical protein
MVSADSPESLAMRIRTAPRGSASASSQVIEPRTRALCAWLELAVKWCAAYGVWVSRRVAISSVESSSDHSGALVAMEAKAAATTPKRAPKRRSLGEPSIAPQCNSKSQPAQALAQLVSMQLEIALNLVIASSVPQPGQNCCTQAFRSGASRQLVAMH